MYGLRKGNLEEGGAFSWNFESYVKRALEMEHLPLCTGSVRGTWRRGGVFLEL
jgi:hypothetical protein